MLTIVEALRYWRPYPHGKKFVVHTDPCLLTYFFAQPNISPRQLQWAENLADFFPWCSI